MLCALSRVPCAVCTVRCVLCALSRVLCALCGVCWRLLPVGASNDISSVCCASLCDVQPSEINAAGRLWLICLPGDSSVGVVYSYKVGARNWILCRD